MHALADVPEEAGVTVPLVVTGVGIAAVAAVQVAEDLSCAADQDAEVATPALAPLPPKGRQLPLLF